MRNDVCVQLKRDSWVAVSKLCADGGDARALINQRCRDTMPERMESPSGVPNDESSGQFFNCGSLQILVQSRFM